MPGNDVQKVTLCEHLFDELRCKKQSVISLGFPETLISLHVSSCELRESCFREFHLQFVEEIGNLT
jgi:hypothetical protein